MQFFFGFWGWNFPKKIKLCICILYVYYKLGHMSFSSLDWDILITSFQIISWPSSNFPLWKTFEVRNCKNMENTLKIKVFGKSILFCKYLRKESLDIIRTQNPGANRVKGLEAKGCKDRTGESSLHINLWQRVVKLILLSFFRNQTWNNVVLDIFWSKGIFRIIRFQAGHYHQ